jgi:hypothetical protein
LSLPLRDDSKVICLITVSVQKLFLRRSEFVWVHSQFDAKCRSYEADVSILWIDITINISSQAAD